MLDLSFIDIGDPVWRSHMRRAPFAMCRTIGGPWPPGLDLAQSVVDLMTPHPTAESFRRVLQSKGEGSR
jgi:hypothetical protein